MDENCSFYLCSWRQTGISYELIEYGGGGGGCTPLYGLQGYVPLNKSVFKDSRESQKSTISLFSVFFFFSFLFFFNSESVFLT